ADRARPLPPRIAALPRLPRELRGHRDPRERDVDADGSRVVPEDLAPAQPRRGRRAGRLASPVSPEPLVEAVDQVGHRLELARDHAEAVLPEVLRLDIERLR